ncbi:FCD domain-containing protein [Kribbella hippodromi]|uniref:FCD domain-containing protein n=1 Tax=Kribbella hippodromi TaxID=434347 RepID=A0ABP4PPY3_9ACTN
MIRRHPLAEQAAEELLRRIGSGEWEVGAKLPGETTLAAQLGVGRSTIREAVRELAGRRVLESRQGAGVFVLALEASEDWDKVLRKADITDVLEGRLAIETEGARLAAARRTPDDLKNFRYTLADRRRAAVSAPDDWYIEADMAFHRAVVTAAHNAVLTELFDTFVPRIRRAMVDMLKMDEEHRHRNDQAAHAAIAEAIRVKDADLAASLAREHLSAVRNSIS